MAPYGQFCPIAAAAEIVTERWTLLVLRELIEQLAVHFFFSPAPKSKRCWWLVLEPTGTDMCLSDPGYGTDLTVRSDPVELAAVYMGDMPLSAARSIDIQGPQHLVRGFTRWFGLSPFIGLERPGRAA